MKHRNFYRVLGIFAAILAFAVMIFCIKTEYRNLDAYPQNETGKTLCINEVMYSGLGLYRDEDGDNSDWIELYNYGDKPVNLWGMSIADHVGINRRWYFPNYVMAPGEYLIVWASAKDKVTDSGQMHTDFMISSSDTITLYYGRDCVDKLHISAPVDPGVSVGRPAKEPGALAVLSNATPEMVNNTRPISYLVRLDDELSPPEFSNESGVYSSDFYLTMTSEDEDAYIFYTLDGSEPDENSNIYSEPIYIHDRSDEPNIIGNVKTTPNYKMNYYWENTYSYKGTVVRARTMKNGVMSDEIVTKSYFISPETDLNIVSLTVDPADMFDERDGIYVPGETYYIWKKYNKESTNTVFPPANYNAEEKVKAHLEIMDSSGSMIADNEVEVEIMGAASRSNAAKGLKVTMADNGEPFDADMFELIPQAAVSNNAEGTDSLLLRAAGTDFNRTMFSDILAQSIVADNMNVTYQAAEPAVLFINGEYWGIHNIREAYGADYFNRHYGIDPSNLSLIKLNTGVDPYVPEISEGTMQDLQDYLDLVEYVKTHDLSVQENFDYVADKIDVESFMDYFITEIYYGNDDWPGNNFRIWRATQPGNKYGDNKWRLVLFDLDDAFLYPEFNSVEYVLTEDYDKEILNGVNLNFDDNREIIIALMQNEKFKADFFERFDQCLDTVFSSEKVLAQIDELQAIYDSEMPAHFSRWHTQDGWLKKIKNKFKYSYSEKDLYTYQRWLARIENMRTFAKERPDNLRSYLSDYKNK